MRYKTELGGLALGGAIAYQQNRSTNRQADAALTEQTAIATADCQRLQEGGRLPPMAVPPPPKPHRNRGIIASYILGMLGTGLAAAVLVGGLALIVAVAAGHGTGSQSKVGGIFAAFLFGVVAFVIAAVMPGVFVGLAVWTREQRVRVRVEIAASRTEFFADHERLRQALETGQTTPAEAICYLQGAAAPLPEPGSAVPPVAVLAVCSAVIRGSGMGYRKMELGPTSTPAEVARILADPHAVERNTCVIKAPDLGEAHAALQWVLSRVQDQDAYHARLAQLCSLPTIDTRATAEISTLATAVGTYRRALANPEPAPPPTGQWAPPPGSPGGFWPSPQPQQQAWGQPPQQWGS